MSNKPNASKLEVSDVEINEEINKDFIDDYIKESCWIVKLNHKYTSKPRPFMRPRFKQVAKFICMGIR